MTWSRDQTLVELYNIYFQIFDTHGLNFQEIRSTNHLKKWLLVKAKLY